MSYKAPADLVAAHPIPQCIPLIEANVRRFHEALQEGYEKMQNKARHEGHAVSAFDAWAFVLVDEVFQDMLEAEVDHDTATAYTEEVERRLNVKIQRAVRIAGKN
jgi:hypothetical protein